MSKVTNNSGAVRPKQRIPKSEKTAEWAEQCGRYYRDACKPAIEEAEAMKNYRLANGELDDREYLHVTNPINTSKWELMGYPAKLKNYDIISPNVNLLMGEKANRRFPPIVYAKNYNHSIQQGELKKKLLIENLQQQFINNSKAMGVPLEQETIVNTFDMINRRVSNLPDEMAQQGQDALEFIIDYNDLPRNFRKGYYDWICQGMVYSYRDVIKDRTYYEIVSPIHLSYLCGPHHDFIENGEAQRVRHKLSVNEIYDRFQTDKEFKKNKALQDYLEQYGDSSSGGRTRSSGYDYALSDQYSTSNLWSNVFGYRPEEEYSDGIEVEHILWRSSTKIGKVPVADIFGNEDFIYVDEDFKTNEDIDIEWEWVDEIWETYCINDMHFVCSRPIPIQRGEYNRPQKAKLLYNGRNFFSRHTRPTSIVRKGESYQKSVNIVKYKAEESLLKSLDKIILFPLGLIPKKEGWTEDKLMYYTRAMSFLFFDDTRPNAAAMVSSMKEINMSMGEHILRSFELVASIKQEYDDVCGINRQRKGNINSSDGKATTEAALNSTYTMSEEMFLEFEEFERTEYTCLMDMSRFAFSDGIYAQFVRTDGQKAMLNIQDPSSYCATDFGVFVRNGSQELQNLNIMKAQVQPFIQNGGSASGVAKLLEANNFSAIHKITEEMDAQLEARAQQEQQMQKEQMASAERIQQGMMDFKYYDAQLKSATELQVALIEEGMQISDKLAALTSGGTASGEEFGQLQMSLEKNTIELMKNATNIKKIAADERMNKEDNKTALKNKTAGEK